MTTTLTAEYNHAVAETQIAAVRVLKRLIETETDPRELRHLAAIITRIKPTPDPKPEPAARLNRAEKCQGAASGTRSA